jgi:hypothetical protein
VNLRISPRLEFRRRLCVLSILGRPAALRSRPVARRVRCTMRSDIILILEQRTRHERLLLRRLGNSRRAASALMPPMQRTGRPLKPVDARGIKEHTETANTHLER